MTLLSRRSAQARRISRYDAPRWPTSARGARSRTVLSHAGTGRVSGFVPLIVDSGTPQRLIVAEASEDFLETYGIVPILAEAFTWTIRATGAPRSRCWATPSGSVSSAVIRTSSVGVLRIQNQPVTIVGVLPAGFYSDTAVWQARQYTDAWLDLRGSGTPVIARLRPGCHAGSGRGSARRRDAAVHDGRAGTGRCSRRDQVDVRRRDRSVSRHDPDAVDGRGSDPCDRVRQCRGTHARARRNTRCGAGDPGIDRCRARTIDPAVAHRKSAAGYGGRGDGVLLAYAALDSLVALIPLSLPANSPVAINATVLAFALGPHGASRRCSSVWCRR